MAQSQHARNPSWVSGRDEVTFRRNASREPPLLAGIVGFLALMAVILGLGLICAKEEPAEIENAVIVFRTDNVRA